MCCLFSLTYYDDMIPIEIRMIGRQSECRHVRGLKVVFACLLSYIDINYRIIPQLFMRYMGFYAKIERMRDTGYTWMRGFSINNSAITAVRTRYLNWLALILADMYISDRYEYT